MSRPSRVRASILGAGLGLLALVVLGAIALGRGEAAELTVFGNAPDFTLTDHLEWTVRSEDLRGNVVVANFVYTGCRDTCPLLSVRMQSLQDRLRQEGLLGTQVQLLSFTVDPARDTPAVLQAYAERHRADPQAWRFLSGPKQEMATLITKGFLLGVTPLPPEEPDHDGAEGGDPHYLVMHSNRFVLIDRQWRIRAYYDGLELDQERVLDDIGQLLP